MEIQTSSVSSMSARRKSASKIPSWTPFLLIGLAVAGAGGAMAWPAYRLMKPAVNLNEPNHADRELVRAWLRDNLPEPQWEEIEWKHEDFPKSGNRRVTLKWRGKNVAGANSVDREIFLLEGDKITGWFLGH